MVRARGYNLPKQMPMIPWLMYIRVSRPRQLCMVDVLCHVACGLGVP